MSTIDIFDKPDLDDDLLAHYGVKGMKWGVHNGEVSANASRGERKAAKKESKLAYKAWKQEVGGEKVANEIFQNATKSFNGAVKIINNDPAFKGKDLTKDARLRRQYDNTVSQVFNQHLATASIERTVTNTGRAMIYQFDGNVGMMRATESQLVLHADDEGYPDFIAEMDALGHIVSLKPANTSGTAVLAQSTMDDVDDFLSHYGVKGMKWGVRKNNYEGASGRTNREARKDADEFARAKMFYGEGAGNRRKLIKAKVDAKAKKDPSYKEAFDHHLNRQDMAKHASKARGERKSKDRRENVRKTGNAINRAINGPFAGSAAVAAVVAGAAYARNSGLDQKAAKAFRDARNNQKLRKDVTDFLKSAANSR